MGVWFGCGQALLFCPPSDNPYLEVILLSQPFPVGTDLFSLMTRAILTVDGQLAVPISNRNYRFTAVDMFNGPLFVGVIDSQFPCVDTNW